MLGAAVKLNGVMSLTDNIDDLRDRNTLHSAHVNPHNHYTHTHSHMHTHTCTLTCTHPTHTKALTRIQVPFKVVKSSIVAKINLVYCSYCTSQLPSVDYYLTQQHIHSTFFNCKA